MGWLQIYTIYESCQSAKIFYKYWNPTEHIVYVTFHVVFKKNKKIKACTWGLIYHITCFRIPTSLAQPWIFKFGLMPAVWILMPSI